MEIQKLPVYPVLTCGLNESAKEIAKKLKEKKERRIFVVGSDGKLKGLITTTDLVYKALGEDNKSIKAEDIMTKNVMAVDICENFEKALEIMNKLESFVCPIVDKEKIVGIVSYHDMVGHIFQSIENFDKDSQISPKFSKGQFLKTEGQN